MKQKRKASGPRRGSARLPKQRRAKLTKEKLVRSAEKLFSEQGFHGTDTKAIARAAGVSTGSFYAYFNDKREVFIEVLNRYIERGSSYARESVHSLSRTDRTRTETTLKDVIRGIREVHSMSPNLHREIMKMALTDIEVSALVRANEERNIALLATLFKSRRKELRVRDVETAATIVYWTVEDTMHRLVDNGDLVEEEKVLKELARMCGRYLLKDDRTTTRVRRGRASRKRARP